MYPGETFCRVVALKRAGLKKKKERRRKLVVCEQLRLGQTEVEWKHQMPILSAGPQLKASQLSLQPLIPTAVASKVGAGERDGTGDGVEQKCTRAETGSTSH